MLLQVKPDNQNAICLFCLVFSEVEDYITNTLHSIKMFHWIYSVLADEEHFKFVGIVCA